MRGVAPRTAAGFEAYNDTRGHQERDLLLALLADRLARLVEGRGRAYRLGGDETALRTADAHKTAQRIAAAAT